MRVADALGRYFDGAGSLRFTSPDGRSPEMGLGAYREVSPVRWLRPRHAARWPGAAKTRSWPRTRRVRREGSSARAGTSTSRLPQQPWPKTCASKGARARAHGVVPDLEALMRAVWIAAPAAHRQAGAANAAAPRNRVAQVFRVLTSNHARRLLIIATR